MKNFGRVLRLSLAYPWTLAGIVATSLAVALLWGGNIGVVYPFFEVIVSGKSLQEWVDDKAATSQAECRRLEQEAEAASDPQTRSIVQDRLAAERKALALFELSRPWIERYVPRDPFRTLLLTIGLLMVSTLIKDSLLVCNLLLVERLSQLVLLELRKACYRTSLDMDMAAFNDQSAGKYLSHFTADSGSVAQGLSHLCGTSLREPLKMIACLAGAAWICWQLLLLSLVCAPISFLLIRSLSRSIKRASRRALEQNTHYFQVISETFAGIQTIKAYTMERFERNRFVRVAHEMYSKSMRTSLYASLAKPVIEVLGVGMISMALVSGAYLVLNQETHLFGIRMCSRPLSFSTLLVFYGLLAGASDPVRKMSEIYSVLQGAVVASDRLYGYLDQKPTITDPAEPRALPTAFQTLHIDRVSFGYRPENLVLRDVSLAIRAGESLAIVGPNGCGKSTLINLLPRFFEPTSGDIRLDDASIRDFRLRDLRSQIGLVTQQTQLFNDTVLNNIRYGTPDATDEQVVEAAKKAHAHSFILDRLEKGYDTVVGQQGTKLSGGQRQRIALARAILRDPAILILDEATSQVDLESEHLIHKALEAFIVGRTAIMITHRLSTLDLADRVVVMDEGRIVDCGTHAELIARCDLYRRLHEIQFRQSA
ncbi:MAG: ABC transporter ATP-binding protein [Pirellulales bacterium]